METAEGESNGLIIDCIAIIIFTKDEIYCNQTVCAADKLAAAAREINSLVPVA